MKIDATKERRIPYGDALVTYKSLLSIVIPIGAIITTIIIFSLQVTSTNQENHLKNSLDQQLQQLRLIIDTHAQTPHAKAATHQQLIIMEARFEKQADRLMAGIKENSEAVREIAELVLSSSDNVDRNQKEIENLRESILKISNKVGM